MTLKLENPCGVGLPGWPRLLRIPCAAAYAGKTVGFIEASLRAGEIPYVIDGSQERVIERTDLDKWIDRLPRQTGKLRHPVAASEARKLAAV